MSLSDLKILTAYALTLRFAAPALVFLSLAAMVYIVASAPTRVSSPLGLRGLKRQRAMANNDAWAMIDPLVRWVGLRVSGIPTEAQKEALNRQLSLAGDFMGLTAEEYIGLFVLGSIAGTVAGGLAGWMLDMGNILMIAGFVLGTASPYLTVSGEAQERMQKMSQSLPNIVDLMALAMNAGLDFPGAIRQVVDKSSNPDEPLVEEFTLILQTINIGRTRRDALLELARRVPTPTIVEFVNSLVQAEERGNPVAEVLLIQAATSRSRRSVRAEEMASKAGVKMTLPLMLVFFAVLALVLAPSLMKIKDGFN